MNEREVYLPQIGIDRIINPLKLIYEGENTPYKLGKASGSKALKTRYISRHGQYTARFLKELRLIEGFKRGNSSEVYECNARIQASLERDDEDTTHRLVAEALLGFTPIQLIIQQTTTGEKELTKELIQEICKHLEIAEYGGTTAPRRAQSIKGLTNWVARMAGIPIRRQGQKHLQPYIPYIYASQAI